MTDGLGVAGGLELTAFISGGGMGSDPWDPRSWSGSSRAVLHAIRARGELACAFGLDLPRWRFASLAIPRYVPDREAWRRRVFRSTAYREALTGRLRQEAAARAAPRAVLQLGAYADGPSAYAGTPVFTYQDGSAATYEESGFGRPACGASATRGEAEAFETRVARRAERVLTTSTWLAASMTARYGLPDGHAVSVGCGVEHPVVATPADHRYDDPQVLFIGTEFERKGGQYLIEAFGRMRRDHPGAALHVVGPPRELVGEHPGVTAYGFLDKADPADLRTLNGLFRTCSVYCLPSLYEPYGIAPIEAMSNAIPAVVTDQGALAENVRDGIDGLHVPRRDVDALTAALRALLSDPERIARMGAAAAATPARISWDEVARNIAAVVAETRS